MASQTETDKVRRAAEASALAARFHGLSVSALRVASTVSQGAHGRRRSGIGTAFWQFRNYETGDAADTIDWRQTAKQGQAYVRETEWEAAQSVWLWRDGSAGMDYRSSAALPTKRDRATVILLAMASLLAAGGEQVGLAGIDHRARPNERTLEALAERLERGTDTGSKLPHLRGRLNANAELILIGDFFGAYDALSERLDEIQGRRLRCHMLQVVDPAEFELPFDGRVRFTGFYNEEATLVPKVATIREDYRHRVEALRESLRDRARRAGWTFLQHRTDHAPHAAVMALYQSLAAPVGAAGGGRLAC